MHLPVSMLGPIMVKSSTTDHYARLPALENLPTSYHLQIADFNAISTIRAGAINSLCLGMHTS